MDLRAGLWWLRVAVGVLAAGCASSEPPQPVVVTQATSTSTNVQVRVRLNCEAICRNIERACRQACRPQAWSPNMQSIQDACERDCDFSRFSCVSECSHG